LQCQGPKEWLDEDYFPQQTLVISEKDWDGWKGWFYRVPWCTRSDGMVEEQENEGRSTTRLELPELPEAAGNHPGCYLEEAPLPSHSKQRSQNNSNRVLDRHKTSSEDWGAF